MNFSSKQYSLIVLGGVMFLACIGWLIFMINKGGLKNKRYNWRKQVAMFILKQLGWEISNITDPMDYKKAVIVVAPHTSNWDFFYGMLFKFIHTEMAIRFAIKKEVMFFPLSCLMKRLGAIPIDRFRSICPMRSSMVDKMSSILDKSEHLCLVIAPEGTRKYVKRWKTGFYRVAKNTNVPIILGYMDYKKKEMGLGPVYYPTDDMEKDLEAILNYYRTKTGKYPNQGVI